MMSYLQNQRSYQTQILHQKCFYGHNDSYHVSFQSADVNLDFWRLGHWAIPGPGDRLKRPCLIGLSCLETKFNPLALIILCTVALTSLPDSISYITYMFLECA